MSDKKIVTMLGEITRGIATIPGSQDGLLGEFFLGTKAQAELLYEAVLPELTEVEQYVLLRYLDLDVPKEFDRYYTMEDRTHLQALRSAKTKAQNITPGNRPAQKK